MCTLYLGDAITITQEGLNLVYETNPDQLEATYGNLLIPLINAVQELSNQVKELKNMVENK